MQIILASKKPPLITCAKQSPQKLHTDNKPNFATGVGVGAWH